MKNQKTLHLTQIALMVAIELVLTYTPLGYLSVPGLSITFLMVPVALSAILLGPLAGAVLGGVFGITSFIQCFGASPFGAALLGISPVLTFLVCVPTRILAGWLPGLVFRASYKPSLGTARKNFVFFGSALLASLLNTALFMGTLVLCFYGTEYIQGLAAGMGAANPLVFVAAFVGVQGLIEAVVCCLLAGILARALYKVVHRAG